MGTTAPRVSEFLSTFEPVVSPRGPLLLASDGSQASDAAFPMARALAAHTGAPVQVISALVPNVMPTYALDAIPTPAIPVSALVAGRQETVREQMARLVSDTPWPVTIRAGDPVREIVRQAEETEARAIVVGRGRHDLLDRILGGESVLRLLQLGDTPVFAVSSELEALPKRVVIATDFSVFSVYAARVALDFVAPDAWVQLVHVAPPFGGNAQVLREFSEEYRREATKTFSTLVAQLRRPGLTFDTMLLDGNASARLVEHLEAVHADLVVTATHGYGFLRRMMLGSVTAQLVRSAPCSVLCVPGSARTLALARAQAMAHHQQTRVLSPEQLDAELAAFSARNLGRECTVEVHQTDIGVHPIGRHLVFSGASLDGPDGRIVLMFGDAAAGHLSHQVRGTGQVELMADPEGRDQLLRISYGGGLTQLVFD